MKRAITLAVLAVGLLSGSLFAQETVSVKVKGMVCSFCAQGLDKKFSEKPAVETVAVSLEKKTVDLVFKNGQTMTDEEIKKTILDSGYNVKSIERGEK
jgi:mercuric ion binding protein